MKFCVSINACKKIENTARAFAAHEDHASSRTLPKWRKKILVQMIEHGEICLIRKQNDEEGIAYLALTDEIKGEQNVIMFREFEAV